MMTTVTETPASHRESTVDFGVLLLTLLLFPAGLILALVQGQKARAAGRSQQPVWVGFAIGAVLLLLAVFFLA